jgi:hypothetical protein
MSTTASASRRESAAVRAAPSAATVQAHLIAISATFALNPVLCFFRVRFMSCSRAIGAFLGQGSTLASRPIFGVYLSSHIRVRTRTKMLTASCGGS